RVLRWFRPDVLHFTGPSDVGQMGAWFGHHQWIPMVGSWHTNVHEYASRRLLASFGMARDERRMRLRMFVEHQTLELATCFYRIPRVLLAPNEEWKTILEARTRKPTFVMTRGVDTAAFTPARRSRTDSAVNIGYVGRLSTEKNVRALAAVRQTLVANGVDNVRFTIIGDGAERGWLSERLPGADFTGVLRGDHLADAYANLDLFAFPSETETVGNVVLEAMASGVPVVAMAQGGPKFIAGSTAGARLAHGADDFVRTCLELVEDDVRRRTMAAAAPAHLMPRSWARVGETVYDAYDAAIAACAGGGDVTGAGLLAIAEKRSA